MGDGEVVHHRERQRLLRELRQAGVLLVALSKNDPATIRWDEMRARHRRTSCCSCSTGARSPTTPVTAIAALDLAADAFVLLDDNPVERALVEENVPGSAASTRAIPSWRWLEHWLRAALDQSDRGGAAPHRAIPRGRAPSPGDGHRTRLRTDDELAAATRRGSPGDSRDLSRVARVRPAHEPVQHHYAPPLRGGVHELLESDAHEVFVASLADRFGDLGVVAAMISRAGVEGEVEAEPRAKPEPRSRSTRSS